LSEKLEELKLSLEEFATLTKIPKKTIILILKGEVSVTPEIAILFENILKIPTSFRIKRQSNYDKYKK
jgi:plasmid maintenance system antidote protein VapI